MQQARGLQNFISDLRNAPSKEIEQQRVDKELANIRQKFANPAKLDAYGRKK
jgi:AP-2 complex subunit alpha